MFDFVGLTIFEEAFEVSAVGENGIFGQAGFDGEVVEEVFDGPAEG